MDEPRLSLARVSFDNCCVITQTSAGAPVPIDQGDTVKGTQITLSFIRIQGATRCDAPSMGSSELASVVFLSFPRGWYGTPPLILKAVSSLEQCRHCRLDANERDGKQAQSMVMLLKP
ncbi:hypothetical protein VUR80DRAFT_4380 [Thermomyces stellatus]